MVSFVCPFTFHINIYLKLDDGNRWRSTLVAYCACVVVYVTIVGSQHANLGAWAKYTINYWESRVVHDTFFNLSKYNDWNVWWRAADDGLPEGMERGEGDGPLQIIQSFSSIFDAYSSFSHKKIAYCRAQPTFIRVRSQHPALVAVSAEAQSFDW